MGERIFAVQRMQTDWIWLILIVVVLMAAADIVLKVFTKKLTESFGKKGAAAIRAARAVLGTVAVIFSVIMTAQLMSGIMTGTGVPPKTSSKSVNVAMMDRYDMYITNKVSGALDGVLAIDKVYWLNDETLIAPKPNPSCYGSTSDPTSLQWLLDEARDKLDIEEFVFDTGVAICEGSEIKYYLDETIFAITWKRFIDNGVYTYAEVKIAHPSQFRRFLAGGTYGADKQFFTTQMASDVNAVLASSGDFYKFRNFGTIVYEGEVKRINNQSAHTCFIDDQGDMIFTYQGELNTLEEAQRFVDENNIRFSIAFGPVLVDNGVRCEPQDYLMGEVNEEYPRAGLCQMGKLHYLVVTAGREEGFFHLSVPDIHKFAERLAETGCEKAYTLDGGQTAAIALGGEMVNPTQYGSQRLISDIFYFATALPEGE